MTVWTATATTELVARPQMGGQGVDVLDAEFELDIHGGFGGATLDVVPPWGLARFDVDLLQGMQVSDVNMHRLWEGRVEEPDLGYRWVPRITVEGSGYGGYLTDDETFQRCYVDNDLGSWQTDQCTRYSNRFVVGIEDDERLVLRVSCQGTSPGQTLADGMNCRAYWQLFDGVTTTQQVTALRFHYLSNLFDLESLRCRLYGRDKLSGGSVDRLLWTSPATADDDDDVSLGAGDIGDDVRVLVWKLDQVGSTITTYTDTSATLDAWSLFAGIAFDAVQVYASDLGSNVTPERVVRNAVLELVDDDHIDFPDTSGYELEHCDFSDPTTIAQVIEDMNEILDWNWGFDDGGVFFYRRPWGAATVPPMELIVTSFADPRLQDWAVRRNFQDCWNYVVGDYLKPNGRIGRVTASDAEGPLGSTWRKKYLDLTDVCSSATDAQNVVEAYLSDSLWPPPTGTLRLRGDAHLSNGGELPALYVRPGMLIRNLDLAAECTGKPAQKGRMLITHVSGRRVAREVTATVGTRANRLTRILARREHDARKVRRKKAKR